MSFNQCYEVILIQYHFCTCN